MLRSILCKFSDIYILVKQTIKSAGNDGDTAAKRFGLIFLICLLWFSARGLCLYWHYLYLTLSLGVATPYTTYNLS